MAHTNSTTNYGLPQWIGSDKPTFLGDFNSAFNTIDTQMKSNADTATGAAETASSANATANSANQTATAADGKATLAKNTADAATSAAQSASDLATIAKNTADSAARTAQANNIANLAPAYDETRTYSVGELVTYIDENNSGKLYKCIFAWNTPGAFNINYWDDVTVSEVFKGKNIQLLSYKAEATDTQKDLVNKISDVINTLNLTVDELYNLLVIYKDGTSSFLFRPQQVRLDGSKVTLNCNTSSSTFLGRLIFIVPRYKTATGIRAQNAHVNTDGTTTITDTTDLQVYANTELEVYLKS